MLLSKDDPDFDVQHMTREQLKSEIRTLRAGIRKHRDASGHNLCHWHPELWGLLPEKKDIIQVPPPVCEFLEKCLQYRFDFKDNLYKPMIMFANPPKEENGEYKGPWEISVHMVTAESNDAPVLYEKTVYENGRVGYRIPKEYIEDKRLEELCDRHIDEQSERMKRFYDAKLGEPHKVDINTSNINSGVTNEQSNEDKNKDDGEKSKKTV